MNSFIPLFLNFSNKVIDDFDFLILLPALFSDRSFDSRICDSWHSAWISGTVQEYGRRGQRVVHFHSAPGDTGLERSAETGVSPDYGGACGRAYALDSAVGSMGNLYRTDCVKEERGMR